MIGFRGYSLYKGFRLYVPLEDELPRDRGGGFQVNAVISAFPYGSLQIVKVPDCTAVSIQEAIGISMAYAMRLAECGQLSPADEQESSYAP